VISDSLKESSSLLLHICANIIIHHVQEMIILQGDTFFLRIRKIFAVWDNKALSGGRR